MHFSESQLNVFCEKWQADESLIELFEHIPDLLFFMKDTRGKLLACNSNHRHNLYRYPHQGDILGKGNMDFYPPAIAQAFIDDDNTVLKQGKPVVGRTELNVTRSGQLGWFYTTKIPMRDASGTIIGLMGVARLLRSAKHSHGPYAKLAPAIEHIESHYNTDIALGDLARRCELSERQFLREFKSLFQMTAIQFLIHLRIHRACQLLRENALTIGEIAWDSGFEDQNYFARQFKKIMAISPSGYRKKMQVTD